MIYSQKLLSSVGDVPCKDEIMKSETTVMWEEGMWPILRYRQSKRPVAGDEGLCIPTNYDTVLVQRMSK